MSPAGDRSQRGHPLAHGITRMLAIGDIGLVSFVELRLGGRIRCQFGR